MIEAEVEFGRADFAASRLGLAVGSRALASPRIELRQPWYRERMVKTFHWILRRILPLELKDTPCGFKLFTAESAKRLFHTARIDGFAFDAEILYLAKRFGSRVDELPVPWFDSVSSRVHAVWHSAQMLKDLVRIRLLDSAGLYESGRVDVSTVPFKSDAGASPKDAGPERN